MDTKTMKQEMQDVLEQNILHFWQTKMTPAEHLKAVLIISLTDKILLMPLIVGPLYLKKLTNAQRPKRMVEKRTK